MSVDQGTGPAGQPERRAQAAESRGSSVDSVADGAVVVVADAHLGGPGGEAGPLARQLDDLRRAQCRRVVFLGDLFHVWVGDRRYETRQIAEMMPAIERLGERGIESVYIEGNRDFFLAESPYAARFDQVVSEHRFTSGGRRYLAVHGDGINREDRAYLFWRWLSKSAASRFLFHRIPGPLARFIVHSTERRLARTNFRHRRELPRRAIEAFAARRLREGHDTVLLGHFHCDWERPLTSGSVRVVDAWYQTPALLWLDDERPRWGACVAIEPCRGPSAAVVEGDRDAA
ncbi:MAG: hypothetical protein DWQ36_01255 [Acidobacteria bacterium]|nr:MAG: hypothetical protein DWQ30_14045 [Acidobacteriota bacterium]REK11641.1 MAG: hypothetical protein DWQ36_01255 [Acidobacteriota bacterium]